MAKYDYTSASYAPNLDYIHTEIESSDMTNKDLEYCNYNQDSSVYSVFFTDPLNIYDKSSLDVIASDSTGVPGARDSRKKLLNAHGNKLIDDLFSSGDQRTFMSSYEDSLRYRPNLQAYIQDWINWVKYVEEHVESKKDDIDDATSVPAVNSIDIDENTLISQAPDISVRGALEVSDDTSLSSFLNENAAVTDSLTSITGPFYLMQILNHRREIYNDSTNPLYHSSVTPILGEDGILVDHADRILNLETIHDKTGYHTQAIEKAGYTRPKDLLIYYGWPNSFNSSINTWNNEKVAQDMAKYRLIVLGDGVQNPSHGDYANTKVIIPRVKEYNPDALVFGYVSADQTYSDYTTKVNQWGLIADVDGIFIDEAGYDFGVTRSEFNQRVDYVHDRTSMNLCFANAWHTDHILGTENDATYPNSTYNDSSAESSLNINDYILLESFPINTASYTDTTGYESKTDWAYRGERMEALRGVYGVNFAAVGIIDNTHGDGSSLFDFGYVSSLMWSLEGFGTSDTYYGASSAAVKYWVRPQTYLLGKIWRLYPSVENDVNDTDVYHRYTETGKLSLDFSEGSETSTMTTF